MMAECPECGKRHVVVWPDLNPFRRGDLFYCSHDCWAQSLRRDMKFIKSVARGRRKGRINMSAKITEAVRARAVEIALGGESPLKYLKECGAGNPSAAWMYIKKQLEKKDPEKFARLPDRLPKGRPAEVETPEGEFTPPTVTVDGPIRIETPEGRLVTEIPVPAATKKAPLEYRVTGISTSIGDFQYFRKQGFIDWTTLDGTAVSMSLAEWAELMKVFPAVRQVLGVEM